MDVCIVIKGVGMYDVGAWCPPCALGARRVEGPCMLGKDDEDGAGSTMFVAAKTERKRRHTAVLGWNKTKQQPCSESVYDGRGRAGQQL